MIQKTISFIIKKGGKDVAENKSCHAHFKLGEYCHLGVGRSHCDQRKFGLSHLVNSCYPFNDY